MTINWKSKIFWINVFSTAVLIIGAIQPVFPKWAEILALVATILTIVLRQLQGQTITIGGKKLPL